MLMSDSGTNHIIVSLVRLYIRAFPLLFLFCTFSITTHSIQIHLTKQPPRDNSQRFAVLSNFHTKPNLDFK